MAISSISAELAYLQSDEPNDRLDWINTFKAALCNIWPLEVRKWLTSKQQWHTNSILKASLSKHSKHTIFGCLFLLLPNQTHHQNSQWFQGTRSNCHCIYSQITCQEPYIACRICSRPRRKRTGAIQPSFKQNQVCWWQIRSHLTGSILPYHRNKCVSNRLHILTTSAHTLTHIHNASC